MYRTALRREGATHTFMVPTQYQAIVQSADATPGEHAPPRERTIGAVWPHGGIATTLKPEVVREKIASVGTPLVGGDSKIIDDAGRVLPRGEIGEIVGYSTGFMRGYHQLPQETADAIWRDALGRTYLRTGDVGRLDEDGYLYILDRKKDMIISGGVNVFPRDIEEVLLTHPQVADAAVIGIHVAKYQRLTDVTFRDALPRNALGKVLKKELRAPYWNPLKQDV